MENKNNSVQNNKFSFLIVEDDISNQNLLELILRKNYNCNITNANDGIEAMDFFNANPNFDIVFMDLRLPAMNGYEAFNKMKEINKNLKIIAITAYAQPEDRLKILNYGFDAYVSKPINIPELVSIANYMLNLTNQM